MGSGSRVSGVVPWVEIRERKGRRDGPRPGEGRRVVWRSEVGPWRTRDGCSPPGSRSRVRTGGSSRDRRGESGGRVLRESRVSGVRVRKPQPRPRRLRRTETGSQAPGPGSSSSTGPVDADRSYTGTVGSGRGEWLGDPGASLPDSSDRHLFPSPPTLDTLSWFPSGVCFFGVCFPLLPSVSFVFRRNPHHRPSSPGGLPLLDPLRLFLRLRPRLNVPSSL